MPAPVAMRILALSGSLRAASSNTAALDAMRLLCPPGVTLTLFASLRSVPLFDPDGDGPVWPPAVAELKRSLATADALVISSPEYARGIAGSLKTALDWLVSGAEMPGKPVALVGTSPRATDGPAALRLVLGTMSARLVEDACVTLPLLGRTLTAEAIVADPVLAAPLRASLAALAAAVSTAG